MAEQGVNHGRRRFLTATTAVVGGVGGVFAAVPFIKAWQPSARAQTAGAPVIADISKLEVGSARDPAMARSAGLDRAAHARSGRRPCPRSTEQLRDPGSENLDQQPEYARNATRSRRPDVAVIVGICTHLGCSPTFFPEMLPQPFDSEWKGGFYCPCHNSRFDMAGRVFQNVPAPANLRVPPHYFIDDNTILIGLDADPKAA